MEALILFSTIIEETTSAFVQRGPPVNESLVASSSFFVLRNCSRSIRGKGVLWSDTQGEKGPVAQSNFFHNFPASFLKIT
jgi:hypothetical protein